MTSSDRTITQLPDLLNALQKKTGLTRYTLFEFWTNLAGYLKFEINPEQFTQMVSNGILQALRELIIKGIRYEKIDSYWEMSRIDEEAECGIIRYLDNLYKVQNQEKSLYCAVEFDSEVEKKFAKDLDSNENVRLFVKLPIWFKIDTPVGGYTPDWAFVTERDEKLYFVCETKSTKDSQKLRVIENQKIDCGRRHFKILTSIIPWQQNYQRLSLAVEKFS